MVQDNTITKATEESRSTDQLKANFVRAIKEYIDNKVPHDEATEKVKHSIYALSGTLSDLDLLKLAGLEKQGLSLNGVATGTINEKDEASETARERKALHNLIIQSAQAAAMQKFNAALDNAKIKIPDIMAPVNREVAKWTLGVYDQQINWRLESSQSLEKVIDSLEKVQEKPTNENIEVAKAQTQGAIDLHAQQKTEIGTQKRDASRLGENAKRRALESLPFAREAAFNLPDQESRDLYTAHLDEVEAWLKSNRKTPLNETYLEEFKKRTNDPSLSPEEKSANQQMLELRKQFITSIKQINAAELLLEKYDDRIDQATAKLKDIKTKLENLKNQPESDRQPNFKEEINFLQIQKASNEKEIKELAEERQTVLKEFQKIELTENERFQKVIDNFKEKYQEKGALTSSSKALDLASQFWETTKGYTKGLVWGEASLRYRYQGHAVIRSAHSNIYYYLDANYNRVPLPVEEQKRFRKLDEDDISSKEKAELQTQAAKEVRGIQSRFTKAADTVADTVSETVSDVYSWVTGAKKQKPQPSFAEQLDGGIPRKNLPNQFNGSAGTTTAVQPEQPILVPVP